jgi:ribosomal protein L37AE/L43A
MSTDKSSAEDEYFAKEEIEKQHKLARELAVRRASEEAEALRLAHWHKCPHCGNDLQSIAFRGVGVWQCFHCHGTWLNAGELEKLAKPEGQHRIIDAVVNVFRRPEG